MRTTPEPKTRAAAIRAHPVISYFLLAYAISWAGALGIVWPYLRHGRPVPKMSGLMMFPVMLLGPCVAGVFLTGILHGKEGLRKLRSRMARIGGFRWLTAVAIPPVLVLAVLLGLRLFVSPVFGPNHFWVGFAFGCAAGFFEETGWTGFAFPAMRLTQSPLRAAVVLGLLWAAWHIPVVDFLGSATPHGAWWLPFFFAFTAAMTAMRVLICWVYSRTGSVLLAQLIHASSTGALAAFGPAAVTAGQEALWYAIYALVLWALLGTAMWRPSPFIRSHRCPDESGPAIESICGETRRRTAAGRSRPPA